MEKTKAEGAAEQLRKQLKDEFGVADLDSAKELLSELNKKLIKLRKANDRELEELEKECGDKLNS